MLPVSGVLWVIPATPSFPSEWESQPFLPPDVRVWEEGAPVLGWDFSLALPPRDYKEDLCPWQQRVGPRTPGRGWGPVSPTQLAEEFGRPY